MPLRLALLVATAVGFPAIAFAQAPSAEGDPIDEIVVTGSQVDLTGAYDGDQVARGARAGILGNLGYLEAPFSSTAYTEALVRQQQAISIADVLRNDPTVRPVKGFGNFQEVYIIRGFPVFSDDVTYNGLYGVLPRQFVAAELVERVEVFRGANAFLNGASPGGSGAGGLINLVPKRAGEENTNIVTLGFQGRGQLSAAGDVSRRFGANDAFGVRLGAVRRDGETAVRGQDQALTVVSLGTDYDAGSLRFSADLGYQASRLDAPRPQVTPLGAAPPVPGTDANYAQPWTFTDEEQLFGTFRGEVDLGRGVTAWAAFGLRSGEEANVLANPNATAEGLTTAYRFDNTREDRVLSGDAGIRADVVTGAIDHRVVASATIVDLRSKNAYALSDFTAPFAGNLYAPTDVPLPPANFFTGGELDDPLTTEETTNTSYAVADTLGFLGGRLSATVGLRYQQIETRSYDYASGQRLSGYEADAVTPALGLVYRPTETVAVFGNYAESLRPGQIAPQTSGGVPIENAGDVLDPFRGEQIEGGIKYDAGGYGVTASAFTLDQPRAIVSNGVFTDGGAQRTSGVELVAYGEIATGVRVIGGATYLDAGIDEAGDDGAGDDTVIGVPDIQANLTVEYDIARLPGLSVDSRVIYTGAQAIDLVGIEEIGDWARLDLGVRYETDRFGPELTLRARAENVTDEGYWASAGGFPGANYLVQGAPRTVLLSVSADY